MHRLHMCWLLVPVYFSRPEHAFATKPGSFCWKTEEKSQKNATRPSAQHATTETAVTQSILVQSKKLATGGDSFDQGYKDLQ